MRHASARRKPSAVPLRLGAIALLLLGAAGGAHGASTCSDCHGMPPIDAAYRNISTGGFRGNHQTHVVPGAVPTSCTPCHSASAIYTTGHMDGIIQLSGNINNSPATGTYSKGVFFNATSNPTLGTCSNINCHFESVTPAWGSAPLTTANGCSVCHASPPADGSHPSATGSGAAHGAYMGTALSSCSWCHPDHTTEAKPFAHATSAANRGLAIVFTKAPNRGGTYTGNVSYPNYLPSKGPGRNGTCTNLYCHSNGRGGAPGVVPTWGSSVALDCNGCHPLAGLSGAHARHINTSVATIFYTYTANRSSGTTYAFGCSDCHPIDPKNHVNGTIDLALTSTDPGGSVSLLRSRNQASPTVTRGAGTLTCSGVYCHSNGAATPTYATTPDWYAGSFTGDRCAACHGNSPNSSIAGSSAHRKHVVGIHYAEIYSGGTGNYPGAAAAGTAAGHGDPAQSTTINCNVCHAQTVTASANDANTACSAAACHGAGGTPKGAAAIANTAFHVNGTADVSFITAVVRTKAQVYGSYFSSYSSSWTRSTYKSGAGSTDTSKKNLSASGWDGGTKTCSNIACHNGRSVSWGDSITCADCHSRL